ncbi:MAG: protein arginine kinase [bacterium]
MLCEICHKNNVSFTIVSLFGYKIKELHVCEGCALYTGSVVHKLQKKLLQRKCSNCSLEQNMVYNTLNNKSFSNIPLFGCPVCYSDFYDELIPLLRRLHGSIMHRGKIAKRSNDLVKNKETDSFSCFRHVSAITPEARWMQGNGPDFDVVVSTRIRLARNLDNHLFSSIANESELKDIADTIENALSDLKSCNYLQNACIINLDEVDSVDRELMIERHLISKDLAERKGTRKIIIGEEEILSIMINEEDHIRLQAIDSGLQIRELWSIINNIDSELEYKVNYAFSPNFGYLTTCPSNVGTGLRVSVMFHIPALAGTRDGNKILSSLSNMGYAIRGLYGEGSQAIGSFYQISNEITLGQTEEEIVENIQSIALQILNYERRARSSLLRESRMGLEDKVFRSYGILKNARVISYKEALDLLSWVNLGIDLGILSGLNKAEIAKLLVLTQPAHLQKLNCDVSDAVKQDISRAKLIRATLNN